MSGSNTYLHPADRPDPRGVRPPGDRPADRRDGAHRPRHDAHPAGRVPAAARDRLVVRGLSVGGASPSPSSPPRSTGCRSTRRVRVHDPARLRRRLRAVTRARRPHARRRRPPALVALGSRAVLVSGAVVHPRLHRGETGRLGRRPEHRPVHGERELDALSCPRSRPTRFRPWRRLPLPMATCRPGRSVLQRQRQPGPRRRHALMEPRWARGRTPYAGSPGRRTPPGRSSPTPTSAKLPRVAARSPASGRHRPHTVLVLNRTNLNLLGEHQPAVYGHDDPRRRGALCHDEAARHGLSVDFRQTNHEGTLVGLGAGGARQHGRDRPQRRGVHAHLGGAPGCARRLPHPRGRGARRRHPRVEFSGAGWPLRGRVRPPTSSGGCVAARGRRLARRHGR